MSRCLWLCSPTGACLWDCLLCQISLTRVSYGYHIEAISTVTFYNSVQYSFVGTPLDWSNIDQPAYINGLSILHVYLMLIVDSIMYSLVTLYISAIMPGNYGVAKPWYFLFTVSSIVTVISNAKSKLYV